MAKEYISPSPLLENWQRECDLTSGARRSQAERKHSPIVSSIELWQGNVFASRIGLLQGASVSLVFVAKSKKDKEGSGCELSKEDLETACEGTQIRG